MSTRILEVQNLRPPVYASSCCVTSVRPWLDEDSLIFPTVVECAKVPPLALNVSVVSVIGGDKLTHKGMRTKSWTCCER